MTRGDLTEAMESRSVLRTQRSAKRCAADPGSNHGGSGSAKHRFARHRVRDAGLSSLKYSRERTAAPDELLSVLALAEGETRWRRMTRRVNPA